MKTNKKGGSKLPIIITIAALVVAIGVFALVYFLNKPKPAETTNDTTAATDVSASVSDTSAQPEEGTKAYTVTVVDKSGNAKDYTGKTDAGYLKELMDEMVKGGDFTYEGDDSEYGLYITTINGEKADYSVDAAYWAIYVNGEYGNYGADQQPVNDGDTFKFVYEKSAQ